MLKSSPAEQLITEFNPVARPGRAAPSFGWTLNGAASSFGCVSAMSKKKKVPATLPVSDGQFQRFLTALNIDDVLTSVIVTTSFIDYALEAFLWTEFIDSAIREKLFSHDEGFLGAYGAKADLAYGFGFIPKGLYNNIRLIGEIRNKIAHKTEEFTFEHPDIASRCQQMIIPAVLWKAIERPVEALDTLDNRSRFINGAGMAFMWLQSMSQDAEQVEFDPSPIWDV